MEQQDPKGHGEDGAGAEAFGLRPDDVLSLSSGEDQRNDTGGQEDGDDDVTRRDNHGSDRYGEEGKPKPSRRLKKTGNKNDQREYRQPPELMIEENVAHW